MYGCFPLLFDGMSCNRAGEESASGHGVSGKERSGMRKSRKGLKDGLLLLALAVAVVAGPGCVGEEVTGNDGVITTTPAVEATNGADAEKESEGQVTEPVVPTEAPTADDEKPTGEERTLPEYEFTVENELYFELAYEFEALTFRSENPDIARAKFMEGEYDYEEERETTGVMLYGLANGETELVVSDTKTGQEVRWKVAVEKPAEESGKQKLIDWLLANGETNDIGDKELTEGTVEDGGRATVEYATMDENINFYFKEKQDDLKIEWNLIPTAEENTEYYITMRIGEDFVTAIVDLATYDGEEIAFEKGWFKVPVEEELQQRSNTVSKRAYEAVRTLLEKETGMMMGEVVR